MTMHPKMHPTINVVQIVQHPTQQGTADVHASNLNKTAKKKYSHTVHIQTITILFTAKVF